MCVLEGFEIYSHIPLINMPQFAAASKENMVGPGSRMKLLICLPNEIDAGALGEGTKKLMKKYGKINSVI